MPKPLPMLFKRGTKGQLLFWEIEIGGGRFRTISGQVGGKAVTSAWTECKPKNVGRVNETTAEDQAKSEAQSAWNKKYDTGYREAIKDIDNTGLIKPMLAKKFHEHEGKITYPVFSQPKLDGMRCLVTRLDMLARTGKRVLSAPHIRRILEPIHKLRPDWIFDGELYAHKFSSDFNSIISLARQVKPTPEDLAASEEHLQYWIYDVITPENLTFEERWAALEEILPANLFGVAASEVMHTSIVLVPTTRVETREELDALQEQYAEQGYEGQMVRAAGSLYDHKRSVSLLKRKEFDDGEFEIADIQPGVGKLAEIAGTAVLLLPDGRTFGAGVNGDHAYARRLLENKHEVVGKLGTVEYFRFTPDGKPRFGKFKGVRDYE